MEEDQAPGEGVVKREAEPGPDQSARTLKRKKTVTWADDDELGLLPAGAGGTPSSLPAAGALSPGAASLQLAQRQREAAVVVLPCDGLYDSLTPDLLEQQVGAPEPAGEEPLTRRQLLERRLAHAEQLGQLYRSELWALLEELRLRHAQFASQPGRSVWREGGGGGGGAARGQAAPTAAPEEQEEAPEEAGAAQQARKRQKQAEGGQAAGDGGEEQQQQQGDKTPSPGVPGEDGAEPGSDPGSALRALWERVQRGEQPSDGQQEEEKGDKSKSQPGRRGRQGKGASRREPAERKRTRRQEQQEAAQAAAGKGGEAGANGAAAQGSKSEADTPGAACEKQQAAPAQSPPPPLLPRFEEIEGLLLGGAAGGLPAPDEAALLAARRRFAQRLALLGRLEQSSLAGTCRELDSLGGLALLCGRRRRFVLRRAAVTLGRCTESAGKVDVDLSAEVEGGVTPQRVSRQQAQLFLDAAEGGWRLRCTGRRGMLVNGAPVAQGQTAALPTLSHITVGGISLLFVANTAATARALGRSGALLAA